VSATAVAAAVSVSVSVEAWELAHVYAGRRGLSALSFALGAPGAVAITGPNGSGKSTLLRLLAGLLPATGGRSLVTVAGRAVPAAQRRAVLGFVSPELAFYEELTCFENLTFAAEARGERDRGARAAVALERVGLAARAHDRVAALSSGMTQRLRLAFALLLRPPLLLLDEPGSHLDEEGRALVERIVDEEARTGLVVIATNESREWGLAAQRIELRGRGLGHSA
jgi:heme exporter protein A